MSDFVIDKVYSSVTGIFGKLTEWKQLKDDVSTKIKLLYLECQRNIALLDVLDLETDNKNIATNDEDYLTIAECLEIDILEMIFFEGKNNNKFFKILDKERVVLDDEGKETKTNIIRTAVFLHTRIYTLKKLAKIPNKGNALKQIRFRARIRNIRASLINISKILETYDDIKVLMD